jgi:hypothetical protein
VESELESAAVAVGFAGSSSLSLLSLLSLLILAFALAAGFALLTGVGASSSLLLPSELSLPDEESLSDEDELSLLLSCARFRFAELSSSEASRERFTPPLTLGTSTGMCTNVRRSSFSAKSASVCAKINCKEHSRPWWMFKQPISAKIEKLHGVSTHSGQLRQQGSCCSLQSTSQKKVEHCRMQFLVLIGRHVWHKRFSWYLMQPEAIK